LANADETDYTFVLSPKWNTDPKTNVTNTSFENVPSSNIWERL